MKRISFALSVLLAFPACHRENPQNEGPQTEDGIAITMSVNDAAWQDDESRTAIGSDKKIYLTGEEEMSVFYKTEGQYSKAICAVPQGESGTYTFTAPADRLSDTWYAIMPHSSVFIAGASSNTGHSVFLSPVQQPTATGFDPRFDFMTAKPFVIESDNTATVEGFKRYFTVLRVDVKNLDPSDVIYAATLTVENTAKAENASASLTGLAYIRMSENIGDVTVTSILKDAGGNSVSAVYDEGLAQTNGVWPLWFVVNPVKLKAGNITLKVSTRNKTYEKTASIPAEKVLSSVKTGSMGFSMAGAVAKESVPWVGRGTSLTIPSLPGKKVTGLRVYADPANRCKANTKETITLKGVEYDFNFCKGSNATALASNGGFCEIFSGDGASLSGETMSVTSGVKISEVILFTAGDADPSALHPSLYITKDQISHLKAKMNTDEGKAIVEKLRQLSIPRTPEEEAKADPAGYRYYYEMRGPVSEVQVKALEYLVGDADASVARDAIEKTLQILQGTNYGTANDMSRASGVAIMVGAIVYDWCYDQLTEQDKNSFINHFKRIAATMECGWPLKGVDYINGHASEWMIMRDLLSAGVAVRNEDSEIYDEVLSLVMSKYTEPRNYAYAGGSQSQGTDYVNVRYVNELFAQWIFRTIGEGELFNADIRNVAYDLLYRMRPDGQVLHYGDSNPNRRSNPKNYSMIGFLSGSYFNDPYLEYLFDMHVASRGDRTDNHCLIHELLWRNFDLQAKAPDSALPLVKYNGTPFGEYIARTGWDENSVIAQMKVSEKHYGNHQHLDAGSFQIYYKGPLAIDSGGYDNYSSPHCMNYSKRTIAHNSLLVYNSSESFNSANYGDGKTSVAANDGGQKMPYSWLTCKSMQDLLSDNYKTGQVVSHWSDGENVYLKGDITSAYSSSKVSMVHRSFFFLNTGKASAPAIMIVYDCVVSRNKGFKKYFLLHSIEEPSINGKIIDIRRTLNGDSGKLHWTVLQPDNCTVNKVGGNGHEFETFGTNYPYSRVEDEAGEMGAWRVELCPAAENTTDRFLNVFEVCDGSYTQYADVRQAGDNTKLMMGAKVGSDIVLFSRNGELRSDTLTFTLTSGATVHVCDLNPGNWKLTDAGEHSQVLTVNEGENILSAQLAKGSYTLQKINN